MIIYIYIYIIYIYLLLIIYIYIYYIYIIDILIHIKNAYVSQKKNIYWIRIVGLKSCGGFVIVNAKPGLSERGIAEWLR